MMQYFWDGESVPRHFYLRQKIKASLEEISPSAAGGTNSMCIGDFADYLTKLSDSQTVALAREVLAIKRHLREEEQTITTDNIAKAKHAEDELSFVAMQIAEPRELNTVDEVE